VEAPHKTIRRITGCIVTVAMLLDYYKQNSGIYFYLLRENGLCVAKKKLALAGAALYVLYCNILCILLY
jgi:hypothetical protein